MPGQYFDVTNCHLLQPQQIISFRTYLPLGAPIFETRQEPRLIVCQAAGDISFSSHLASFFIGP